MKASLILPLALFPLALAFTSCTKKEGEAAATNAAEQADDTAEAAKVAEDATGAAAQAADAAGDAVANLIEGVHSVECGCKDVVTSTTKCGNYVQIGGKYLEIEGDLGLGKMEWCSTTGTKAQVKGSVKDGKFMGESLTVVP